jgi:hypothetical protein
MESKKTDDLETKKDGYLADDEEEEPEWFALPVSRLGIPPALSTPTKRRDFRFDEFSNHRGASQNAVSIFY